MDLHELNITELKLMAKEKGITNISKMKKEELIAELERISDETDIKEEVMEEDNNYKLTNEGDAIIEGILEVMPDGYGFLRGHNYLPSPKDVYVSPIQIRRFKLNTGDKIKGISRTTDEEKFPALIFVGEVNGERS